MTTKYDPDNFNDDDLMSALKEEGKIATGNRDKHDVKLEKEGEIWHIRFLPARFGPRGLFFSRIAQHWINKRPYYCEKATSPDSGGDENAQCDLCDVSSELSEHRVKDVATLGFKSGASPQWLTFCLVWSKKVPGMDLWEPEGDEVWTPHKFWLNKTLFEEVREYYVRHREKRPNIKDSILSPEHGFDFYVKKSNNKLVLQRDDPRSIFAEGASDAEKADLMQFIMDQIKAPNYRPLSPEEMEAARIKLEDAARKLELGGASTARRGPARSSDGDDVDIPQRSQPSSRFGSRNSSQVAESGQTNTRPAPSARSAPPARSVPSARPSPVSRPSTPSQPDNSSNDDDNVSFGNETQSVNNTRQESPSARLRQASQQPRNSSAQSRPEPQSKPQITSTVDDDDSVTDESTDHIPPDMAPQDDIEDAPPAPVSKVQQQQQNPRSAVKMSERLRGAVQRTQQ